MGWTWWSLARIGWAVAALALVAAAYLTWPLRPAPIGEPDAVVARAPRPEAPAPAEAVAPPREAAPARGAGDQPTAAAPATLRAAATIEPAPMPYEFTTPPLVAPLGAPPAVVIAPLAESPLVIEPIAIDRLTFDPIVIEPLRTTR